MAEIEKLHEHIDALDSMGKYPEPLWCIGNKKLLEYPKVSIVGTRRPGLYSQTQTANLVRELVRRGVVIVSGAAMGIDAVAHSAAGADNTIAVMANGLDIRYPAVNRTLIESIEKNGLVLSQFEIGSRPGNWSFVVRNEIVVALGEKLVIAEADENSGSVRSAEYAVKMGKEIYVFPHRLGESAGTHRLLREGLAKPIYSISDFAAMFGNAVDRSVERDDFFYIPSFLDKL